MKMNSGGWCVLRAGEDYRRRQAMAIPSVLHILLIFSLVGHSFAEDEASPRGCGSLLTRPFTKLCDLDAVWGVAVAVAAGVAVLASLILALVLLCRLRRITEPEARSGVAPLILLLATTIMLSALSFAHIIESQEHVCIARHVLWGVLSVLSAAYKVTQGMRLLRHTGFRILASLVIGMAVIPAFAMLEWILAVVRHPGQPVCQYQPLSIALACIYGLVLLVAVPITLVGGMAQGESLMRCRMLWLLCMSCTSGGLWAIWVACNHILKMTPGQSTSWEDQLWAEVLAVQAWLLLLFHAAPEAYACLRPPRQPSGPDGVGPAPAPPRSREASIEEGLPLSPQPSVESQGSPSHSSSGTVLSVLLH
ncbi:G-protein coupled receptor family C group 5 member B-like isoform X6 [Brienomyrus brachyistius]|uniref:G-protein coupled receptor family C group 5 member B-like isoform X5 n=1 Tax=Brienomyrus brachyistius TaxID=42636 RepID=UPI0020B3381C|nr:G-protein coupled receptor family C group 5 member B-like isoform X5 [Brienomyrus brachyistius]XP_048844922.1 G-protein coupled receptor family C group 5 member B-like isoform X6 [Brienomyrus brachyistius]